MPQPPYGVESRGALGPRLPGGAGSPYPSGSGRNYLAPALREALAFGAGRTALYKLHLKLTARYSEDIDLVQAKAEPAGPMMDALREALDSWIIFMAG
jgi:hypothetical protein